MVRTKNKIDIYVFADWNFIEGPLLIGILSAHIGKGRKSFSFAYDKLWLKEMKHNAFDPEIQFFSGAQYPNNKENFGVFTDSMPDTWGRTLMKRREFQLAKAEKREARNLYDIDFLLGVYDQSRMGALRFKTEIDGAFLDENDLNPTPPWSKLGELQNAAKLFEYDRENAAIKEYLGILIAPGSSLGGARPKANILDSNNNDLWIAKFPSKTDTIDKAAWEYLAYKLALKCKIEMSECRLEKIGSKFHTFLTKRFDRKNGKRVHFSSAMTMTGNTEDSIKENTASYLDLVEVIESGAYVKANLHQLWKRIVFNIAISNTDDHLRNHGFILKPEGWILSPAYDLNPSIDKTGLSLNIDSDNNELDFELAKSVGIYFRLNESEMDSIMNEVLHAVQTWKEVAKSLGISRSEMEIMKNAFRV
jgi:serine/threonine-protein kinase HipA